MVSGATHCAAHSAGDIELTAHAARRIQICFIRLLKWSRNDRLRIDASTVQINLNVYVRGSSTAHYILNILHNPDGLARNDKTTSMNPACRAGVHDPNIVPVIGRDVDRPQRMVWISKAYRGNHSRSWRKNVLTYRAKIVGSSVSWDSGNVPSACTIIPTASCITASFDISGGIRPSIQIQSEMIRL